MLGFAKHRVFPLRKDDYAKPQPFHFSLKNGPLILPPSEEQEKPQALKIKPRRLDPEQPPLLQNKPRFSQNQLLHAAIEPQTFFPAKDPEFHKMPSFVQELIPIQILQHRPLIHHHMLPFVRFQKLHKPTLL